MAAVQLGRGFWGKGWVLSAALMAKRSQPPGKLLHGAGGFGQHPPGRCLLLLSAPVTPRTPFSRRAVLGRALTPCIGAMLMQDIPLGRLSAAVM